MAKFEGGWVAKRWGGGAGDGWLSEWDRYVVAKRGGCVRVAKLKARLLATAALEPGDAL